MPDCPACGAEFDDEHANYCPWCGMSLLPGDGILTNEYQDETALRWYDRPWVVGLLLLFFWPAAVYALLRNRSFTTGARRVAWSICLVFALVSVGAVMTGGESSRSAPTVGAGETGDEDRPGSTQEAWVQCRNIARDQLAAVGPAPTPDEAEQTTYEGEGRYRVRMHADTDGRTGAQVRTEVICVIEAEAESEEWRLVDLEARTE